MTPASLSTGLFYDRAKTAMGSLGARATLLETQISTGKRLQAPSDNTVAYDRLQRLARATTDQTGYTANTDLASSLLAQSDTTLSSMQTQVQRASELVLRANNNTLSATDRKAVGAELTQILESMVELANSRDTRGQPLFGGTDGLPAVTMEAGVPKYSQGTPNAIPVGDGQSVQPTERAERAFALPGGKDMLALLSQLATTLETGAALATGQGDEAIDDLTAANDQISGTRASLGARATRLDLIQAQATEIAADRETERSGLEDTDLTTAITDLQKTMTVLSATQASFAKLSALSLFDYLR